MKKVFLIAAVLLLISESCNCQWYNRQYGVSDLNQLSQQQLNGALRKAKSGVVCGSVLSIVSAAGIFGGISIASNAAPGDLEAALAGIGLAGISVSTEITGLIVLFSHVSRAERIKEIMKKKEIKLGVTNYQNDKMVSGSSGSFPGFSLAFRF
jgi:hypothetical protein